MRGTALKTLLFALAVVACGSVDRKEPLPVLLSVSVTDHLDQPVAGAVVAIDGEKRGETDAEGTFAARLRGAEGRLVRVGVGCPPGSAPEDDEMQQLRLRRLRRIGVDGKVEPVPIETDFVCAPTSRAHLLAVRTDGRAELPVLLNGRKVAATNEAGVAQLALEGEPGEELVITLDTSQRPELRPSSPLRRLRLPERSRIFLFGQSFEQREAKRGRRRKRRSNPGPRRL
ncbi:MAG: hypothetical protein R6V85_07730 [Polyangia bacterium]